MKYVVGIDPGINGAVAIIDSEGGMEDVFDMPTMMSGKRKNGKEKRMVDERVLAQILRAWSHCDDLAIWIEEVHASPQMGSVSLFTFGQVYGTIRGCAAGVGLEVNTVTPKVWKQHFNLGTDKEESRAKAIRLFDDEENFRRKKDADRAEAALIALYGLGQD